MDNIQTRIQEMTMIVKGGVGSGNRTNHPKRGSFDATINRVMHRRKYANAYGQLLFTQTEVGKIPPIGATEKQGDKAIVHAKLFTPDSSFTWHVMEHDPETGQMFGLTHNAATGESELGYFNLNELRAARGKMGLPIERDKWEKKKTLGEVKASYNRDR